VTITGVKLSGDKRPGQGGLHGARHAAQRRTTERALRDAASHIQQVLAPSMRMRNLPELRFVYDESIEKESKMLELLGGLEAERAQREPPPAEAELPGGAELPGAAEDEAPLDDHD
jgi:ribosome-binding factor A